ncbi:DoxX family protein [Amycolatopsis sp. FDAARGOS 1241]|uniref:DoxX family protein n=1 Tax=Amycolatopsis sp. FDAARGOS 1241 TaxID=2778070 RepID=UPI0019511F9C|nr:DoxX family protein [Amycolatopsis sp. FDAARGOS 1241]QRP48050.1 DoxX family protein [Amycolatopsis sp. FDAARGOS 1241]
MNIALWIAQGVLALVYLAAGGLMVVRPREELVASGNFDWMEDSSDAGVKAVGLVVVQIGALRVHLARDERRPLRANVVLLLAAFAAAARFPG